MITNAAREGARVAVLPGYGTADVIARVEQFLTAAGLNAAHPPPVIVTATIPVGSQCASLTSVTVTYPQTLSMVAGIASYFGATGLGSRTAITATSQMRNEVPAGGCGP